MSGHGICCKDGNLTYPHNWQGRCLADDDGDGNCAFHPKGCPMKVIYIAGPMTGLPEFNKPAFFEAEERLRQDGWLVANPATTGNHPSYLRSEEKIWRWYMREAIKILVACSDIALLPGWMDSRGAKLEYLIAQNLGMTTWDYQDGELSMLGTRPSLETRITMDTHSAAGGV